MPHSEAYDVDENSPLVSAEASSQDGDVEALDLSEPSSESKSAWYLLLLTLSIGGLQIVWSVELSNGSPYLLSLGMSKAFLAVVWIAGPLSGVLVQPYVGIRSDNCRVAWGKRKPFMIGGSAATIVALFILAWTREIVYGFLGLFGVESTSDVAKWSTIIFGTAAMWVLDFAINTVQAGIRAFIVDNAPAHQQESANAWASRVTGVGNMFGYVFGYVDLPRHFPFFGNTQFKVLCVVAAIALGSTVLISCIFVKERDPRLEGPPKNTDLGVISFFRQVFNSIKRLPPSIRKVCEIQFAYWIGWFPMLFYITTYIGQLYVDPFLKPDLSEEEVDALWVEATRIGTFALLIYAITSFAANIILPFIVEPTYKPATSSSDSSSAIPQISDLGARRRASSSSFGENPYNAASGNLLVSSDYTHHAVTSPGIISRTLLKLQIPGLTLRRMWLISQLLFALCMFSTFLIRTPQAATIMTAVVGISWSLTLWAPFALISAEVAKRDEDQRRRRRLNLSKPPDPAAEGDEDDEDEEGEEDSDQAGVILGLHNVAISSPQILATLISSVVFKILQKPRGVPGDVSVGWTLRIGGVASLAAAFLTWRMGEIEGEG